MSKTPLLLWIGLAALACGCANPTTAYHRQFDYLARMGDAAAAEGRLDEAHEYWSQAAGLAQFAHAGDLEFVDVLTRLGEVSRQIGRIDEARSRMKTAGRVLQRFVSRDGQGGSEYGRIAGSYALERARLETLLGDLTQAEALLVEFSSVRGKGRGDRLEAAEAHWLLGELLLGRDLVGHARYEFGAALPLVRDLEEAEGAEIALLRGSIFLRVAETEIEQDRLDEARSLVEATRPEGVGLLVLRPGMLLVLARIDVAERNVERARIRLDEAFELLAAGEVRDIAALGRAVSVASQVFDAKSEAAQLFDALDRGTALAGKAPPLGALLLGRALIAAGRDLIAAGQRTHGLRALDSGRRVIEKSLAGHPHIALIQSDFAIAMALEALGRLDAASRRCALVRAATIRRAETGPEETRRLVACGRIDARLHRADPARRAFLAALANGEASGDDSLRFEMLLRLAALARLERRHSSETKLFERALPLLAPQMKRVHGLLTDVYSSLGSTQPSSAAARFAHAAVRTRDHYDSASRLQAIAAALSEPGNVPASRR